MHSHCGIRLRVSKLLFFIFLFTSPFVSCLSLANANNVLIYIRDDVYNDYVSFVNQRDVLEIKNFSGKSIRRDVVDMIIAQQALKLGGFTNEFKYSPGKVNFRNTKMLQEGKLLISFDSYWKSDANELADKLYISSPLIRKGEYVAGVYTSPQNKKVLKVKTLEGLSKLTAVSTPKWKTDWDTLKSLQLKDLIREDSWLSMARMVNLQWVDFMLMPFNGKDDQSFKVRNIHLVPVKNIAILLKDSRHFVISKSHPYGKAAHIAINKGLKILRSRGTIKKAYIEAGFFVQSSQYKILNQ